MSTDGDKNQKLFIGNLASRTNKEDIEKHFGDTGKIAEVVIKEKGPNTYGFVEFESIKDAEDVLEKFNNTDLRGNAMRI